MEASDCAVLWGDEAGWFASRLDASSLAARDTYWLTHHPVDLIEAGGFLALSPGGAWGIGQFFDTPGGKELFVAGVVSPGRAELLALFDAAKLIALRTGCEIIRFGSARKGWRRVAPRLGFFEGDDDEFVMKVA
jgi:hypothetical protein